MKSYAALILAGAALASAQTIASLVAGIPTCADACFLQFIPQVCGSITDYGCQCSHTSELQTDLQPCILGACDIANAQKVQSISLEVCSVYSRDASASAATTTTAAPSSSSAAAVATSTTTAAAVTTTTAAATTATSTPMSTSTEATSSAVVAPTSESSAMATSSAAAVSSSMVESSTMTMESSTMTMATSTMAAASSTTPVTAFTGAAAPMATSGPIGAVLAAAAIALAL